MASSDSETASVECFVSETDLTPIQDGCEFFISILKDFVLRWGQFRRKHTKHSTGFWKHFHYSMPFSVRLLPNSIHLRCKPTLITVWAFLLLLFGLALKHHKNGHKDIWFSPVTTFDWFGRGSSSKKAGKLPAPVTSRPSRSRSRSKPPAVVAAAPPRRHASERHTRTPRPPHGRQPQMAYIPTEQRPSRTRTTDRYRPDYYRRDASPRR